jgi:hypothetical protein
MLGLYPSKGVLQPGMRLVIFDTDYEELQKAPTQEEEILSICRPEAGGKVPARSCGGEVYREARQT